MRFRRTRFKRKFGKSRFSRRRRFGKRRGNSTRPLRVGVRF